MKNRYFKVFLITLLILSQSIKGLNSPINTELTEDTYVENTRSVIAGKDAAGNYKNVGISAEESLEVSLTNPRTAFGEIKVAQLQPTVQLQFPYNINPTLLEILTTNSASQTIDNARLKVSTGTTPGSLSATLSREMVKYEPGQGNEIRFSAIFTTGIPGTLQLIGLGDSENKLAFGYNGDTFGILLGYGGIDEAWVLNLTTAPTRNGTLSIVLNGLPTFTIPILATDTLGEIAKKICDADFTANLSGFYAYYQGNKVLFISIGSGPKNGAYSFNPGTTGMAATLSQVRAGIAGTDLFIPQSNWSEDKADGNSILPLIDFSLGNIYRIQYQWLGYGMIKFDIQDPRTANFITVHKYSNDSNLPSLHNATMPMGIAASNGVTNSDVSVYTSSMAAFSQGIKKTSRVKHSFSNTININSTEQPIFALYVKRIFNGITNRVKILLDHISIGNNSKQFATFRIYRNKLLTGTFSFNDININNSVVSYSTDCTASNLIANTGQEIMTLFLTAGESRDRYFLDPFSFYPGDFIVITAQGNGGASSTVGFACSWSEDF